MSCQRQLVDEIFQSVNEGEQSSEIGNHFHAVRSYGDCLAFRHLKRDAARRSDTGAASNTSRGRQQPPLAEHRADILLNDVDHNLRRLTQAVHDIGGWQCDGHSLA